jgi:hypothetical protein
MKRLLLSLFTVSVLTVAWGQNKMVNYTIIEDNPDAYKKTTLFIEPFFAEAYKGFAMGYGLKFETQVADFVPWVYYKKAYLDVNTVSSVVDILPAEKLYKFSIFEFGATWFFSDKNKATDIGIDLKSNRISSSTVAYTAINAKGTKKIMHGLDFGLFMGKNTIDIEADIDKNQNELYQYQRVSDGFTVPIYFSEPQGTVQPKGESWLVYTSYATKTFFFGYHLRSVINYKIMADGYGSRAKRSIFNWYTQFFFTPNTEFNNVFDTKAVEWAIIPIEGVKTNSNFGFKTGFSLKVVNAMQFYAELGYKPGPKHTPSALSGAFINVGYGVFFGSKKGFLLKY